MIIAPFMAFPSYHSITMPYPIPRVIFWELNPEPQSEKGGECRKSNQMRIFLITGIQAESLQLVAFVAILIKPRIWLCIAFLVHRQELHHAIGTLCMAHGSNLEKRYPSNSGWENIIDGDSLTLTGDWPLTANQCFLKRFVN